jgi:hypothetical protein
MILHTTIGGLGMTALPELPAGNQKKPSPTHEEHEHEPVHHVDQVIHTASVLGVVLRNTQVFDKSVSEEMHN